MRGSLRAAALVALIGVAALRAEAKTRLVFYVDTEDYTCDYSNDGIRDLARLFTREGVRGCFNITGYLALRIQELGRQDVIEALKPHTLGIQTLYHSRHPTPAEVADDPDWERAYRRALRDESMAFGMVEAVFGEGRVVFSCPPGASISPSMMEAHADLGIVFGAGNGYVGGDVQNEHPCQVARPGLAVDGLWYFNLYQAPYSVQINLDDIVPGAARVPAGSRETPDWKPVLDDLARYDFVGIGSHPNMQGHREFWDAVNYNRGNLVPWRQWKEAERLDPADTAQYYRNVASLIRAIKADGRFRLTDFDEMRKGVRPRRAITRDDLPMIRTALMREFGCIREPASWCVSDVFQAAVRMLRGETRHEPGKVYGFLSRPRGVTAPTTVSADGLRATARGLDLGTFLPPEIEVDGRKIGPADFLFGALDVLVTGATSVTLTPREQLGSFKEIPSLEKQNLAGSWVHLPSFKDEFVSERLRLQLWTLRIDPCELPNLDESKRWTAKLTDPLEWLYPDGKAEDLSTFSEIDVAANGVAEANVFLTGLDPSVDLVCSADIDGGSWYRLVDVPVERNTAPRLFGPDENVPKNPYAFVEHEQGPRNPYVTRRAPFRVFDAMEPIVGPVRPGVSTVALRWRLGLPPIQKGSFVVHLTVRQDSEVRTLPLKVNVYPVHLPEVGLKSFKYTNWCDFPGMADRHGIERWSDPHYEIIGRYLRLAVRGRQNTTWLPIALLFSGENGELRFERTRFLRLVEVLQTSGISWIEGGHLGAADGAGFKIAVTGRSADTAEGVRDLAEMCRILSGAVEEAGVKDHWLQHVADEPCDRNIAAYLRLADQVRGLMPGTKLIDAIEHTNALTVLDIPVPKTKGWVEHRVAYDAFARQHPHSTWCYVCCEPGGRWLNRLSDGELLRPTYLSWACALFDFDGFLHWGYNMYGKMDPFTRGCRDHHHGTMLPAGDTHIVYPGRNGPWPSIRQEAHRAGMEDLEILRVLKAREPVFADESIRRLVRAFDDYTPDAQLYRRVRREVLARVADQDATK